ncbi:hypothetical protein HDU85_007623 [Gaertneriomyces sp. JEL0708]|nr:hypothetical protein HDU85_007623 [Gaertneriomyces sp. JEL0708]
MSWIGLLLYLVGSMVSQSALNKVLGQASYFLVGIHESFAIIYVISIRDLLLGYGVFVVSATEQPVTGKKSLKQDEQAPK